MCVYIGIYVNMQTLKLKIYNPNNVYVNHVINLCKPSYFWWVFPYSTGVCTK